MNSKTVLVASTAEVARDIRKMQWCEHSLRPSHAFMHRIALGKIWPGRSQAFILEKNV